MDKPDPDILRRTTKLRVDGQVRPPAGGAADGSPVYDLAPEADQVVDALSENLGLGADHKPKADLKRRSPRVQGGILLPDRKPMNEARELTVGEGLEHRLRYQRELQRHQAAQPPRQLTPRELYKRGEEATVRATSAAWARYVPPKLRARWVELYGALPR